MAKNSSGKNGGSSKLRFVMLEADLSDGDLSALTAAITNALRPAAHHGRSVLGPGAVVPPLAADHGEDDGPDDPDGGTESDVEPSTRAPRSSSGPRVYRMPEVLDIDLAPFAKWAKTLLGADEGPSRHLAAAYWFRERGATPNVTIDHAYSAYRAVGWPSTSKDFDKPFRQLKKKGHVKRVEPGVYTITLPGINEVEKLTKTPEADAGA